MQTKYVLMGAIALEGFGGLLFTVGSSVGAYLLVQYWPLRFKKLVENCCVHNILNLVNLKF